MTYEEAQGGTKMTNEKFRYEYVDMFEKRIFSALQKVVSDDITRLNMVSIRYNHVKDELFATDGYRFLLLRNCEEFELVFDRVKGDSDSYWTLNGDEYPGFADSFPDK